MPRLHPEDLEKLGEMVSEKVSAKLETLIGRSETLSKASTFSVNEVAGLMGKHPSTIMNHIKKNLLKASKPGKDWIITQKALNEYTNGK